MRATRIRLARVALGFTQQRAAASAGISNSRWSLLERELLPASTGEQRRIARVLKTSPDALFSPERGAALATKQ